MKKEQNLKDNLRKRFYQRFLNEAEEDTVSSTIEILSTVVNDLQNLGDEAGAASAPAAPATGALAMDGGRGAVLVAGARHFPEFPTIGNSPRKVFAAALGATRACLGPGPPGAAQGSRRPWRPQPGPLQKITWGRAGIPKDL